MTGERYVALVVRQSCQLNPQHKPFLIAAAKGRNLQRTKGTEGRMIVVGMASMDISKEAATNGNENSRQQRGLLATTAVLIADEDGE